jgi:hypothetical protein
MLNFSQLHHQVPVHSWAERKNRRALAGVKLFGGDYTLGIMPLHIKRALRRKIITQFMNIFLSWSGSGKSLALLCASLAWQEAEQKRVDEFNSLLTLAATNQASFLFGQVL